METGRRDHGDLFTVRWPGAGPIVFVADPELVKQIFTGRPHELHAGESNRLLEPAVGPRSLLLLDETEHLRDRRLLLPPFHGERVRGYRALIEEIVDARVDRWPVGRPFALEPEMSAITLEIIVRAVFGVEDAARRAELGTALRAMLDAGQNRLRFFVLMAVAGAPRAQRALEHALPFARFFRARKRVDALLRAEIARHRGLPDLEQRTAILSLLVQARREDGSPLRDDELRDELVTMLAAGHETTATAAAWAFALLFAHPVAHARLRASVREGDGAYADAVVTETLRLRPPVSIVLRRTCVPLTLGGHTLPVGSYVAPCPYLVHRRPELYPEPRAFRPEHFLGTAPGTYTWIPFGGGVRRCLGASFALLELRTVLERVTARTELAPAGSGPEPVVRRGVVLAPGRGTPAVMRQRPR